MSEIFGIIFRIKCVNYKSDRIGSIVINEVYTEIDIPNNKDFIIFSLLNKNKQLDIFTEIIFDARCQINGKEDSRRDISWGYSDVGNFVNNILEKNLTEMIFTFEEKIPIAELTNKEFKGYV